MACGFAARCRFRLQLRKANMARTAMLLEIALMAFLGLPEGGGGLDLGDHRLLPLARCFEFGLLLGGDAGLFRAMGEDHRTVLGAEVRSLAVLLGGVVHAEEQVHQAGIGHLRRVERHFHHFGMIGVVMAHLLVGRVLGGAAGIAADRLADAGHLAEEVFHAPEAARSECRLFHDRTFLQIAPIIRAERMSVTWVSAGARASPSRYRSAWPFPPLRRCRHPWLPACCRIPSGCCPPWPARGCRCWPDEGMFLLSPGWRRRACCWPRSSRIALAFWPIPLVSYLLLQQSRAGGCRERCHHRRRGGGIGH